MVVDAKSHHVTRYRPAEMNEGQVQCQIAPGAIGAKNIRVILCNLVSRIQLVTICLVPMFWIFSPFQELGTHVLDG